MLVSEFIDLFKGLETNNVLGGFSYLQIVQQVIDDIYADDNFSRIYRPEQYITTNNGDFEVPFTSILPAFQDVNFQTTIRRIRGIWEEDLSPAQPGIVDYGRNAVPNFNQKDIHNRVYDGDIYIDNEQKIVRFKNNPGDTTTKWKADFYLRAPLIETDDEIPLLHGWEKRLLIPGCRAFFEELDLGAPGPNFNIFQQQLSKYRNAVLREDQKPEKTQDLGIIKDPDVVNPL